MDKPEIIKIILQQWHSVARSLILRYQLAGFQDQLDLLRCFKLDRVTTSPTADYFHSLPLLTNLVSLTISPDARISSDGFNKRTGQHDPSQLCLAGLLPQLDKLQHLYIHGQDLRCRTSPQSTPESLGGTDAALLSFAVSRREKGLPGLQTLSIISSPDLTDRGINGYIETSFHQDSLSFDSTSTLGKTLRSLTLVNCPRLTPYALTSLEQHCSSLAQLTLRDVDGIFDPSRLELPEREESANPCQSFISLVKKNSKLRSFAFASNLATLPSDFFSSFNDPNSALQDLHIHPSKAIRRHHLTCFPSIYRLTITGCPKLGDDLPFDKMPRLQELSFLGRGLSLQSLWKLFKNGMIRKMTLDVAGSAYETCICADNASTEEQDQLATPISSEKEKTHSEKHPFPLFLEVYKQHNILSSAIPSFVVTFFLACSPPSLESIALHGAIVPTCCSTRSTTPPPPLSAGNASWQTQSGDNRSLLNRRSWWNPLQSATLFWPMIRFFPDLVTRAFLTRCNGNTLWPVHDDSRRVQILLSPGHDAAAANTLAQLSFRILQGRVAGSLDGCPLPESTEAGAPGPASEKYQSTSSAPDSDSSTFRWENVVESTASDTARSDIPRQDQSPTSWRRRRASSTSGLTHRKSKVARKMLQRSASEYVSGAITNRAWTSDDKVSYKEQCQLGVPSTCSAEDVAKDCSERDTSSKPPASNIEDVPSNLSANEKQQAAFIELLALSTSDSASPPPTFSHYGNVGTSRLSPQQVEWLHSFTNNRIVRLEV